MSENHTTETLSPVVPTALEEATERLLKDACDKDLKLATAESCTGGLVASLLTDVEGASHAFERGFIVYSEQAKCELLGVRRELIDDCTAVSKAVALAMAEGAIEASKADVAFAVTGYAGKAGPDGEPGLVHFACARRGRPTVHREAHFGDIGRGAVRIACLQVAIEMMHEAIR